MRFGCRLTILVAAVLIAVSGASWATVFGTVRIVVHDAQHRPVPGATVSITALRSSWTRTVTTGTDGEVAVTAVPLGDYAVDVELTGFRPAHAAVTVLSNASPVLHVELEVGSLSQAVDVSGSPEASYPASMTPTTLVDRIDIADTPGASRTNSVSMITAFVPGSYVVHDQLHVRGGHQVSWMVDGVPVPNTNIANNVGPQFDPKDADYIEAHRGSYGAEYGDRTYAVFNVVPRTGFERNNDADVVVSAGSYGQTNDQVSAGGHSERLAYYVSATANRSGLGLQTPTASVLHDRQTGLGAFGTLLFNVDPANQLRLVASIRRDTFQVPNTPEAQAAGVDSVEGESDAFVNLSWVRAFPSGALLTVSPFFHQSAARYDGSSTGVPVETTDHRVSRYSGGQATLRVTAGRHVLQVGAYGFHQQDDQRLDLVFDEGGRPGLAVRQRPSGSLFSLFVQDTLAATSWLSVNAGVRQTHFSGGVSEDAVDPRAGVTVRFPWFGCVARAFYGRFYQAPPLSTVSGPVLDFVSSQNLALTPLHGERDEEFQAGLTVPLAGWTLDADLFRTDAKNFFDHNNVGNSNVSFPLTIDRARIRGAELSVRSPRSWKKASVHLAYSRQVAEGMAGTSGGLTDFSPASDTFPLDHDQRHTLSAGADAHLGLGAFAGATVSYGSGFPDEGGPGRLEGHTTVDLVVGRSFNDNVSLSVTALNVTNRHLLIDNSPTFGGTHFNHPREVYAELRYRFHY
jgi:outer membrane receptor protein involved in Fe transport